jgi:hypothetical protein
MTPKNDVIPVNLQWNVTGYGPTKGEIIVETKERETQKVSHELPTLLDNNAAS